MNNYTIRLLFWDDDEFDFGADYTGASRWFVKMPYSFYESHYFTDATVAGKAMLMYLIYRASVRSSDVVVVSKSRSNSVLGSIRGGSVGVLNALVDLQAIEIIEYPKTIKKEIKKERKKALPVKSEEKKDASIDPNAPTVEWVVDVWNKHMCPPLAEIRKVNAGRRRDIKRGIKLMKTKENIQKAMIEMKSSPWHIGDNDRNWRADVDFFFRKDAEHAVKFLEKYESPADGLTSVERDFLKKVDEAKGLGEKPVKTQNEASE